MIMRSKLFTVFLLILVVIGTWIYVKKQASYRPDLANQAESVQLEPAINGVMVKPEVAGLRLIAVVVENHPDARPQSGLSQADIVYESLTEGGITRFLALFQTSEPEKVGSIRSARPNFNFIANMLNSAYVHVGGSDMALEQIEGGELKNITDINEFYNGKLFERDDTKTAPHNAFTSIGKLRQWLQDKNYTKWNKLEIAKFDEQPNIEGLTTATQLEIPFSTPSYKVSYNFNTETKQYRRYMNGSAHLDATNKQSITPTTILLQFADADYLPVKDTTSVNLNLKGQGTLIAFHSGITVTGKWKYQNGKVEYYSKDGSLLVLPRGQIWIELLPKDMINKVTWK